MFVEELVLRIHLTRLHGAKTQMIKIKIQQIKFSMSASRRHIAGEEAWLHTFLISALGGGTQTASYRCRFTGVTAPIYLMNKRLGGLQNRFRRFGRENLFPMREFETVS